MIERLAERLADLQVKKPWLVLMLLFGLLAVASYGFTAVEILASTEAILPETNPAVQSLDTLRSQFYGDIVTLRVEADDVTRYAFLQRVDAVTKRIEHVDNVGGVTSPTTILRQTYGDIPANYAVREEAGYQGTTNTFRDVAIIQVQTDTQASTAETRALRNDIESILRDQGLLHATTITGYSIIDLEMFSVILNDFSKITGIAFSAVLTVLYLYFRSVKQIFLTVTPVMFALVVMVGVGSWIGAKLTIISMVSAAMIMGLGIDFGIHVVKKLYSEDVTHLHIRKSQAELSKGLLGGALTTSTGFLALLAAQLTGMHSLGIYLATGILAAYVGATVLLPTIIVLLEKPQENKI